MKKETIFAATFLLFILTSCAEKEPEIWTPHPEAFMIPEDGCIELEEYDRITDSDVPSKIIVGNKTFVPPPITKGNIFNYSVYNDEEYFRIIFFSEDGSLIEGDEEEYFRCSRTTINELNQKNMTHLIDDLCYDFPKIGEVKIDSLAESIKVCYDRYNESRWG